MVDWIVSGDESGFTHIESRDAYGGLRRSGVATTSRAIPSLARIEAEREDKPVVFLLPGIMGTHLAKGDDRYWIHVPRLAWGGLPKLAIDAPGIEPNGLVESVYESMIEDDFLHKNQPPSPERVLVDGVLDEEVRQAMGRLPEEYRSVVLMALVEEMSYKEIASALSIPLGTVMSRLHRGRKMLQVSLLEYATRRGIIQRRADVSADEDAVS